MENERTNRGFGRYRTFALPLIIGAVSFLLFWSLHDKRTNISSWSKADSSTTSFPVPGLHSEFDTLTAGTSLHASLLRKNISIEQVTSLLAELGNVIDLRKSLPGESYELITDPEGSMKQFRYFKGPGEVLVVEPIEDGLTIFQENVPLTKSVRKVEGQIDVSLYDAVCSSGGNAELAMLLSDIFAWDIDFFTDPRSGDRFSLLVEEYMRGQHRTGYGKILAARYDGGETSKEAYFFTLADGKDGYFDSKGKSLRRAFLRSPLNYRRISSYFTNRRFHPILKRYRAHHGVDYAARYGTPVVTVGDGVIEYAGWKGGYGRFVCVRHNSSYKTTYGHLSGFGKRTARGTRVAQGQVVGYVGSSGLSTGPHLDFRMMRDGSFVNPLALKTPTLSPVPQAEMETFKFQVGVLSNALNTLSPSEAMELPDFEQKFFGDSVSAIVASGKRF